ncbi:uncharacterized protein [Misgurnus anguillicaudatus]|uniref:uncharacterized protein n=1 Tax=Misgurnus anguillicaudatus TaxID=75329 RepID=UPI003CCF9C25
MDGSKATDMDMAGGTHMANDTGLAKGICKENDTGLDKQLRVRNGKKQDERQKFVERKYLKEATVILNVENVMDLKAEDIIMAVTEKCGHGKILALRPRQGKEFELTMEKEELCDKLMDGLTIKGVDCEVKSLQNRDYVVSFMHLPAYLEDEEILLKLERWGVDPMSKIKRRCYPGTDIEDGTRFLKVRFPKEVASLPYSTKLETEEGPQYFRVMHSHQVKTCRMCMSPDHLLKDCPNFLCYKCEERGHFARDCNAVRCPECQVVLNKCECWMEGEEGGRKEQETGQVHEGNNKDEGQTDEKQEEEVSQRKEMEDRMNNKEEGERENENAENREQAMEQDTQWTELETPDNISLDDEERDGQEMTDQDKDTDSEEGIKMDNMDKDGKEKRQIRRRAMKVKPNLKSARKKFTTRYDVLRAFEGESGENDV